MRKVGAGRVRKAIARRLRAVREQRRLSQAELAARTGLTQQALSGFERGEHKLSLETLDDIARELDIPFAALLWDDDQGNLEPLVERARRVLIALPSDEAETLIEIMEAFGVVRADRGTRGGSRGA